MSEIVSLHEFKAKRDEQDRYWMHAELMCMKCHHRAIYVFCLESDLRDLECGGCGDKGFLINTGQDAMWEMREAFGLKPGYDGNGK